MTIPPEESTRATGKYDTEMLNLKTLNYAEVKEQYHSTILNRSATFENTGDNADINRPLESVLQEYKKIKPTRV